ncbi:hypothetical protein LY76DRAFT_11316 [Colletotrichum caudatum]|nr:hypothetical protein LY76DRAFT_11316 [Colletotrichum caudatum]
MFSVCALDSPKNPATARYTYSPCPPTSCFPCNSPILLSSTSASPLTSLTTSLTACRGSLSPESTAPSPSPPLTTRRALRGTLPTPTAAAAQKRRRRMKRGCMVKRREAMAKEDNGPPLEYLTACDSAASTARRKAVGSRPFLHTCLAACLRWILKARLPPARRAYHLSRALAVSSAHLTRLLLQSRYFPLREDPGKTRVFRWSFTHSHPPTCISWYPYLSCARERR